MREERKVVTVLAADLVGSTALSERLDPEEVRLVVGEAVARMVRIVEELGGTVKDTPGDGLLALFGAPVAHEDDPERAVRAGLRIVHETKRHGAEVAQAWDVPPLAVRVGVHTGPIVLGSLGVGEGIQHAAFGDTLNTAARLQSVAQPDTVLVGATTRRFIEPAFDWGDEKQYSLKGKTEPVAASEATAVLSASSKVRGLEGAPTRFVGRDRELQMTADVVESARAGSGSVLFISGEPGIGKSRLLGETRSMSQRPGADHRRLLWLEGRCVSYGESMPYWPYRDLIRDWLGVSPDEPELRARVALRRHVERLFADRTLEIYPYLGAMLGLALEPDAASRLTPLSPEALQYRTFEVIRLLFERLADDGPVVVAIEDLHWADATSVQLTERLLPVTEAAAVVLAFTVRLERDHASWRVKETAAREFPHRTREIALEAFGGEVDRELLSSLIGPGTLPPALETQVLAAAEGNPFYLEELVRTMADSGALMRQKSGWRFDHEVPLEIPGSVEKVILARIDRLTPACRDVIAAASVLGRRFSLPLLKGVGGDGAMQDALHELQRLDLLREGRRWPEPEYRFKHVLIQETAYRTLLTVQRERLHRRAAEWLEQQHAGNQDEVLGLLAHHWLAAANEEKAIVYLTRAGDKARLEYALDEAIGHYRALLPLLDRRGEKRGMALVLFKLALALHTSLRFADANAIYQQGFQHWTPPDPWPGPANATMRVAQSVIPSNPDPTLSYQLPNIQMCMALYDRLVERWPEATIVPSLAERWEISDDGLRYLFHLRNGLRWSDGVPITAHDVVYAIQRILNPDRPGDSVAIYFVLENALDFYLRRHRDPERIGVRAPDERTVEFRLVAPAPYFMSVVNRSDSGPLPRHAIERYGEAWTELDRQVVSGAFVRVEWSADRVVLERRAEDMWPRSGNVGRVEYVRETVEGIAKGYAHDEIDLADMRATFDLTPIFAVAGQDAHPGPPAGVLYIVLDHAHPAISRVDFRRALAHAIDRDALRKLVSTNLAIATGGLVPPPLQGHTPDIAPRFDPDLASDCLRRSGADGRLSMLAVPGTLAGVLVEAVAAMWRDVLGLVIEVRRLTLAEYGKLEHPREIAPIFTSGWFPGYPDPEYFLRLLLHSDASDNEGGYRDPAFDALIERARQERSDRSRLELFHEADRMAVADQAAVIPLAYTRNVTFLKPWVYGWWEFGKSWSSFAHLVVDHSSRTAHQSGSF